jgi:hypothetical protein
MRPPLYLAAGGGGDAIAAAALHASRWPEVRAVIATFAWDRLMVDPIPGPRSASDFTGLHELAHQNFVFTKDTRPVPPAGSTLPRLAAEVDATFVLLDPAQGATGLQAQVATLVATTGAEHVEVVDVGGDILGKGTEPELRSPLADALALAATDTLPVPVTVLVAGPGLDGELPEDTVMTRIEQLRGQHVMRVGHAETVWAMPVLEWHPSEATALLLAAGRGIRGTVEIRGGGQRVELTDKSPNVYALSHSAVWSINEPARAVRGTTSFDDAHRAVAASCGKSEISFEIARSAEVRSRQTEEPDTLAAVAAATRYGRTARERGIQYVTFRRLAEVVGTNASGATKLRDDLIRNCGDHYEPPLWRI